MLGIDGDSSAKLSPPREATWAALFSFFSSLADLVLLPSERGGGALDLLEVEFEVEADGLDILVVYRVSQYDALGVWGVIPLLSSSERLQWADVSVSFVVERIRSTKKVYETVVVAFQIYWHSFLVAPIA